ncbi:ss-1,4-galactosyltransferase [Campylobacter devanensis]|uniref:Glycosyltransferase, family 2 n=1 Tax=Campylobacter devanensis TaxID=3161138 RepID=A0A1X9SQF3_9BACT|nr:MULTISPECIES: glycosyltransferase family 2 protein [Campylobacter]ARQ98472.1 glycosyltransferase, family 2 [Campylobacter lanienae]MEE3711917.1 glycosyltransferase family 2 protein [Campylobacter sp. CLAX-7218-21]SUX01519.1 ss-1,4-galactosyltransferase [Campylobacter lanienae]
MSNPKVSIIIPVYNVEKYLRECLDSVINQTLKDIAIICINDGSTDSSLEILKEYAKNDSRIHIVDKINGGLGAARNSGIKYLIDSNINPKYIYFADSDDWLDIQALEKLYNKSQESNSDICIMEVARYIEATNKIDKKDPWYTNKCYKIRKNDVCSFDEIKSVLFSSCCMAYCHLYSYEFLINYLWKNEEFYPQNLLFEDIYPHIKSLILAKRIAFLDEALYYYRIREGSIMTSSAKSKRTFDIFKTFDLIENFLIEQNLMNELKIDFYSFICGAIDSKLSLTNYKEEFVRTSKYYLDKFDGSLNKDKKIKKQHLKLMLNLNNPYDKKLIKIKNKIIYRFNRLKWSLGVE